MMHRAAWPRWLMGLLCLLAALMSRASPAAASETAAQKLARARDAFREAKYEQAIPLLNFLLYPDARLSSRSELVEAHILLGVSYFETKDKVAAAREFEQALSFDAELTLDPLLFSDGAIQLFDAKKRLAKQKAKDDQKRLRLAMERQAYARALSNLYVIEKRKYYVNFIPFGAGQFQNGHRKKGAAFFVSQSLLAGTSVLMYGLQVTKYGYTGPVPAEDVGFVNKLQTIQIATGGLAIALMAWGIVDALVYYKPKVERRPDKSLLPKHLRDIEPGMVPGAPRPKKPGSSFLIVPTATPRGGGVLMRWEF